MLPVNSLLGQKVVIIVLCVIFIIQKKRGYWYGAHIKEEFVLTLRLVSSLSFCKNIILIPGKTNCRHSPVQVHKLSSKVE